MVQLPILSLTRPGVDMRLPRVRHVGTPALRTPSSGSAYPTEQTTPGSSSDTERLLAGVANPARVFPPIVYVPTGPAQACRPRIGHP